MFELVQKTGEDLELRNQFLNEQQKKHVLEGIDEVDYIVLPPIVEEAELEEEQEVIAGSGFCSWLTNGSVSFRNYE